MLAYDELLKGTGSASAGRVSGPEIFADGLKSGMLMDMSDLLPKDAEFNWIDYPAAIRKHGLSFGGKVRWQILV